MQDSDVGRIDKVVRTRLEANVLGDAVDIPIAPQEASRCRIEDCVEGLVQDLFALLRIEGRSLQPQPVIDVGVGYSDAG